VLSALLGIEHIDVEDRHAVTVALNLFNTGMDLADAWQLFRSNGAASFVTFDRKRAKRRNSWGFPASRVPEMSVQNDAGYSAPEGKRSRA